MGFIGPTAPGGAQEQRPAATIDVKDKVVRTRPLCAYPTFARYEGTGDFDDASNFECVRESYRRIGLGGFAASLRFPMPPFGDVGTIAQPCPRKRIAPLPTSLTGDVFFDPD